MNMFLSVIALIVLSGCSFANPPNAASNNEYCEIIQATIDLPKVQQYFHVDVRPERSPLRIATPFNIGDCPDIKKFGVSAIILQETHHSNYSKVGYFEFINISVNEETADVMFYYKIEGIRGTVKLHKVEDEWLISESEIVEI